MSHADQLVDRAAARLQKLADEFAADGGGKAKLAEELAADAAFLRKLKPSLMAARFRGELPTNSKPDEGIVAPAGPQLARRPRTGGPSPLVVVGVAFAAGIVVARIFSWRGHGRSRG